MHPLPRGFDFQISSSHLSLVLLREAMPQRLSLWIWCSNLVAKLDEICWNNSLSLSIDTSLDLVINSQTCLGTTLLGIKSGLPSLNKATPLKHLLQSSAFLLKQNMGVSINGATPKSSMLKGFSTSHYKPCSYWGTPMYGVFRPISSSTRNAWSHLGIIHVQEKGWETWENMGKNIVLYTESIYAHRIHVWYIC